MIEFDIDMSREQLKDFVESQGGKVNITAYYAGPHGKFHGEPRYLYYYFFGEFKFRGCKSDKRNKLRIQLSNIEAEKSSLLKMIMLEYLEQQSKKQFV